MGYLDRIMPSAASALVTRWHRSLWSGFIPHLCNNVLVQSIVKEGI